MKLFSNLYGLKKSQVLLFRKITLLLLWISVFLFWGYISSWNVYAQEELPDDLEVTIAQFDAADYPEINLYINAKDADGNYVTGLTDEDFIVLEDNETVTISDFAGIGEQRAVDVIYVFDTTGSMSDEITGLIQTSITFAEELESKERDYRLGLITFGDNVRQVFQSDDSLTSDVEVFKNWLTGLKAEGGDQDPENSYAALLRAVQMHYRADAQSVLILITDAPPHHYGDQTDDGQSFDDPQLQLQPVLDQLTENNISVYAVTPNIAEFVSIATDTGGKFFDIANNPDFTGVIEEIGAIIANQYRITYISPRPSFDGTRRDVTVRLGDADITTAYHEQHLLNVESSCLVGLLCLFPLIAALVLPFAVQSLFRFTKSTKSEKNSRIIQAEKLKQQTLVDTEPPLVSSLDVVTDSTIQSPIPSLEPFICQNCGDQLRIGSKFCPACGQPVYDDIPPTEMVPTLPEPSLNECPHCSQKIRPGAKFCNHCGKSLIS